METHGLEMAGPFRSGDGVDAISIASGTGDVTVLTDAEIDGDAQLDGTVKITGGSPLAGKVIVATDGNGTCSWVYASVPATEIFIFESNVQVTGYTLLTGVNDAVVYITEGTPGGEAAATYKSGGTWTQPTHDHGAFGAFTGYHALTIAEMPQHRHGGHNGNRFYSSGTSNIGKGGNTYPTEGTTGYAGGRYDGGPALGHRHSMSGISASGTVNTWRPYGRNYTRQQKN